MAEEISQGAVHNLYYSDPAPESGVFQPTLQALSVKRIQTPAGNTTERYRVILSDGQHYLQSMLATQLNPLIESKQIDKNSLLKLTGYSMNYVQGRRLLILLAADIVQAQVDQKFGNPSAIDNLGAPGANNNSPAGGSAPKAENSNNTKPAVQETKPAQTGPVRGGAAGARGGRGGAAGRGGAGGASASRGGGGGAPMGPLYPIEGLSPYQNKWTIKARVTQKSDIKHWSNQRGEGKLFSVTLMDETAEIKATGFNEAVDNFYEKLQEGKVYYVSRARVNIAKKQFSNINNEYEIMFENNTEIEPCDDDNVPQVQYKFVPISEIANVEKDQTVDILAVVKEVGELGSITSKATQKPFAKRDLTLVDQSQHSIRLTLWGKQAENFKGDEQPVIAAKGVKVGDFGGRSLSMFSSSTMSLHPDIDQAHALKGWFDAEGMSVQYQTYSNSGMGGGAGGAQAIRPDEIKTIGQVKDDNIGTSDKTEYFSTRATINFVKHETFSYPACPTEGCNKKVVEEGDGWRCEKCDRTYPAPLHRYILSLSIMDHSGHIWVTAFNDVGEQLLGKTANELIELKDMDEAAFSAAFTKAQARSLTFSCSARQDTFNDQTRVRYSIRRAIPIDYKTEAMNLAKLIEAM